MKSAFIPTIVIMALLAAASASAEITLFATADNAGYLEPCG